MKIYSKKGDFGQTTLSDGIRQDKDALAFECLGSLDELNSWIGLIRDQKETSSFNSDLIEIQNTLFGIGAYISSKTENDHLPTSETVESMEYRIDVLTKRLPKLSHFILAGGHSTISYCQISRSICRRTERHLVSYHKEMNMPNYHLVYMNRLSDYLFTLARIISFELNIKEIKWNSKKN